MTDQFRIRFTASDTDPQSVVEAGIDGLQFSAFFCNDGICPWDITGDGQVDVADLVETIVNWGPCSGCAADVNGDGTVDVTDLTSVIINWGSCP